jgi:serine/threonine-protein kinase
MSDGLQGYELRSKVGADHLGEIWMALRKSPPGLVRVRLVSFQSVNESGVQARYLDEVRRAFKAAHAGLVPGVEVGADDGRVFTVVEWPDGETLAERLRREGRLTQAEAIRIVADAAAALEAAWSSGGVWHGHLTPDRIHLWPEGRVSVLDLGQTGIVPLRASEMVADYLRVLRAVPFYSAPELVRGAASVDFRADMYSLGALLYQALTGTAPFGDRPAAEALDQHLMGFLDDPSEIHRGLTRGAGWLIEKMMARDPARRYVAWADFRADLAAVRGGRDPSGQRLEAGVSVVRRGPKRESGTPAAAPGLKVAARKGRMPVLRPRKMAAARSAIPMPSTSDSGASLRLAVIGLVLIGGGAIGVRHHMQKNRIVLETPRSAGEVARERAMASRTARPEPAPRAQADTPPMAFEEIYGPARTRDDSGAATPPPSRFGPQATVPSEGIAMGPGQGDERDALAEHPAFQKAAGLFNAALAVYHEFEKTKDASQLDRVAAMSEEAAKMFAQIESQFPGDRRVRKYIEQCFGLARYARQSYLASGRIGDSRPSRRRPSLPAPPSTQRRPVRPLLPDMESPQAAAEGLKLGPAWNAPIRVGAGLVRELRDLLAPHGSPVADMSPKPGLMIHPGIPYLERLDRVATRLGIPPIGGTGDDVTFPGFPERSLRYFAFDSSDANPPYKGGRLIVDMARHAVGVQWIDTTPSGQTMLPEEMFAPKWSIYDPIGGKIRDRPSHRIAHRVRSSNGMIQIDTEVVDPAAPPNARSLGRYSLRIAQPIVNLTLLRMSAAP